MKITFLGSSHGVPAKDRYCSSLMIEVSESIYVIDTGAPLVDRLLQHDKVPKDVKAIFFTHSHGDHLNGLLSFVDLGTWFYKDVSVDIHMTEERALEGVTAYLKGILGGHNKERIRFSVVPSDFVYDDGQLKVTYIPTKHIEGGNRPTYAMLLEAEGKRVVVTGDLSQGLRYADFPKLVAEEDTDLVICEMAHFGVSAVRPYLETARTKELWFTHVYPYHRFDDIEAAKADFPYPIHIAHDDDVIEL